MNGRKGAFRARCVLVLLLLALSLLAACGRKAKPEPRWGAISPAHVRFQTR